MAGGHQMLLGTGGGLEVTLTNPSPTGHDQGFTSCGSVSSNGTTANVSGGSGSYTYLWTLDGPAATNGPYSVVPSINAATVSWGATVCFDDAQPTENWKVTVTDTVTGKQGSAVAAVTLTWADLT